MNGTPGMVTGDDIWAADDACKSIAKKKGYWYVDQFNNADGIDIHQKTTGPEIYK